MILYLETSALVKLYVREKGSDSLSKIVRTADVVATSVVSYAEARSAFARKYREKGISGVAYENIKAALDRDWASYFVLNVTPGVARAAGNLAEKHALRGFDALHLASAVEMRAAGAAALSFCSADDRLLAAARLEGFESVAL